MGRTHYLSLLLILLSYLNINKAQNDTNDTTTEVPMDISSTIYYSTTTAQPTSDPTLEPTTSDPTTAMPTYDPTTAAPSTASSTMVTIQYIANAVMIAPNSSEPFITAKLTPDPRGINKVTANNQWKLYQIQSNPLNDWYVYIRNNSFIIDYSQVRVSVLVMLPFHLGDYY